MLVLMCSRHCQLQTWQLNATNLAIAFLCMQIWFIDFIFYGLHALHLFDTPALAPLVALLQLILRYTRANSVRLTSLKKCTTCEARFNLLALYSNANSSHCTTTTAGNIRVASQMLLLTQRISNLSSKKKKKILHTPRQCRHTISRLQLFTTNARKRTNDKLPPLYNSYFCIFFFLVLVVVCYSLLYLGVCLLSINIMHQHLSPIIYCHLADQGFGFNWYILVHAIILWECVCVRCSVLLTTVTG